MSHGQRGRRPSQNVYGVDATNEEKARFLEGGSFDDSSPLSKSFTDHAGGTPVESHPKSYVDEYDNKINQNTDGGARLV